MHLKASHIFGGPTRDPRVLRVRNAPQEGPPAAAPNASADVASGAADAAAISEAAAAALAELAEAPGAGGSHGSGAAEPENNPQRAFRATWLLKEQQVWRKFPPELAQICMGRMVKFTEAAREQQRPNAHIYRRPWDKNWFNPSYDGPVKIRTSEHKCRCAVKDCGVYLEAAQMCGWPARMRQIAVNHVTYWDAFHVEDAITVWHNQGPYPGPRTWAPLCLYPQHLEAFASNRPPSYFTCFLDDNFEPKHSKVAFTFRRNGVAFQKLHHGRAWNWWSSLTALAKIYVLEHEDVYG